MTGKERFDIALRGGQPDMVPMWELAFIEYSIIGIAKQFTDDVPPFKLLHEMDANEVVALLRTLFFVVEKLDLDGFTLPAQQGNEVVGENLVRDKLGIVYIPSDNGLAQPVKGVITSREELEGFKRPGVDESWFMAAKLAQMYFKGERAVMVMPPDPWKTFWALIGDMTKALMMFYDDPELARGILGAATDVCVDVINAGADCGMEYYCLAGDLAMNSGTMMSPATFREFIKPCYTRAVGAAHARGIPIIKHCCGDITRIIDDFIESGFDGIHPVQPQCMDIVEAKAKCRGRASVLGNIDCIELLPNGSVEEVEAAVRETIRRAAPGGGFILSSANSIHKDVRPENAVALYRAGRKYGRYPVEG